MLLCYNVTNLGHIMKEKEEAARQRAEDIAYTINHALVCAATDIVDPFVAAWSQKHLGRVLHTSWCNKTHDHEHHDHEHHACEAHSKHTAQEEEVFHRCGGHGSVTFGGALKHWVIGEAIGDAGAVPVAIAFQRYAPGFMDWLGRGMEAVLGDAYKRGAGQAARDWAMAQGKTTDSSECKEYAGELYRYEVRHFGQAAVWTAASVGLNIGSQKLITGNRHPVSYMLLYKTLGAATTAAILLGGRALVPERFHRWDQWSARHIFAPATHTLSSMLGVTPPKENWSDRLGGETKAGSTAAEMPR